MITKNNVFQCHGQSELDLNFYWFLLNFLPYHTPQFHSVPSLCPPFTIATSPNRKKIKSHCGSIYVSECVCVSQDKILSTLLCLEMFIVMNCWSGPSPLASAILSNLDPHWDISQIFCHYVVSWRSCFFFIYRAGIIMYSTSSWRSHCKVGPI